MGRAKRTMWDRDGLHVWAEIVDDGRLQIAGQHLYESGGEHEYWLTVAASDIPAVRAALGATPTDDVLDLLQRNGEKICQQGEMTWLQSLGLEPEFFSRVE